MRDNIRLVNKALPKDDFERYKEYITKTIEDWFDDLLVNVSIEVRIEKFQEKPNYITKTQPVAEVSGKGRNYVMTLYDKTVYEIDRNNGLEFDLAIYHELGHIYDMYHLLDNKFYSFDVNKKEFKEEHEFIIHQGFKFWTEFYAYYLTFKHFKDYIKSPTFLEVVGGYKNLKDMYNKLPKVEKIENKQDQLLYDDFVERANDFVYVIALFLAGDCFRTKQPKYSEKTKNDEYFQLVDNLCSDIMKILCKIIKKPYDKSMLKHLMKMGEVIISKVFVPFYCVPIKYKGGYKFAFFCE